MSQALVEKICFLAQLHPFEKASQYLERFFHISVSKSCIHEIAKKVGTVLFDKETQKSLKPPIENNFTESKEEFPKRVYAEIDGAHINTKNGYKENKLAIVFEAITKQLAGGKEKVSLLKRAFTSSLALGCEDFKNRFHLLLVETKNYWAQEIIVISDGADWIANIVSQLLPGTIHILDWYHMTEHLWACAKKMFGELSPECAIWVEKYKTYFMEDTPDIVIQNLELELLTAKNQTPLRELLTYFSPRKNNMRYKLFRSKGYYIGSGAIESANKYVIQERLKRPGMKWSIKGGNAIGRLRAICNSDGWEKIWQRAA
jgi:hypothetical protein